MVRLPRNEKQTCRLNSRPQLWPSGLTLAMTLTLNFQSNIWNFLYLSQNPIATKQKANISIELQASNVTNVCELDHNFDLWILKVKRDLDPWPHTWPWPWIFMVKFWNSCISGWEGRLTLHKGVAVGHSWPWPWPFGDQGQVMDLPDSDRGDFSCRRAVDSSSLAVRCTRFDTMNALLWMAQNFGTFIARDTPNHWVYFDGYCKMTSNSQDTSSGLCVANSQEISSVG